MANSPTAPSSVVEFMKSSKYPLSITHMSLGYRPSCLRSTVSYGSSSSIPILLSPWLLSPFSVDTHDLPGSCYSHWQVNRVMVSSIIDLVIRLVCTSTYLEAGLCHTRNLATQQMQACPSQRDIMTGVWEMQLIFGSARARLYGPSRAVSHKMTHGVDPRLWIPGK